MPKQPKRLPSDLPRQKVLGAVKHLGFVLEREGQRHSIYKAADNPNRLMSIPRHSRMKRQLLQGILSGAGVTEEEFMACISPSRWFTKWQQATANQAFARVCTWLSLR
jgi:predicted RNA binding protein YcfA (HicA-like mRNA interferase family)